MILIYDQADLFLSTDYLCDLEQLTQPLGVVHHLWVGDKICLTGVS